MRKQWMRFPVACAVFLVAVLAAPSAFSASLPGGSLDPTLVPKYQAPLVIPPAMPRTGKVKQKKAKNIDYYEIAVRQFRQQILPAPLPPTTVWSYGNAADPTPAVAPSATSSFNYPAFTIEAKWRKPVRVKWINDLMDPVTGNYLPHLLPVDQTLHWANPPQVCKDGTPRTDCRGTSQQPYTGPVPMIVHVHGAETTEDSDGYPEAWYLPAANDIDPAYATGGSFYDTFRGSSPIGADWAPGSAVFQYPNDQEATTLWYHDHSLGMTRQNVYAGPAGFFLLRGGPGDMVLDAATGLPATLPGPAPSLGDPPGLTYYEIPIVIQDRSFNADGELFYPDNRAFFEGLAPPQLQIPFIPENAVYPGGLTLQSDVSPIWNPEFFGNTMVVNGTTWPYLNVEPRRYRLRLLNGSNSRFLIVKMDNGMPFWQIGAEQGFLPAPVMLPDLLIGPAERADVIVDFTGMAAGTTITMLNLGPDEPFGGGIPGVDFDPSDPGTTGQVMQFRVTAAVYPDPSTPVAQLLLPAPPVLPAVANATRTITLNEEESATVFVSEDAGGNIVLDEPGDPFGPTEALLGVLHPDGSSTPLGWADPTSENVMNPGDTEVWEIYNFTADAHPIHIHLIQFQVVDRQALAVDFEGVATQPAMLVGVPRPPELWETGFKDTVIAYPGEVTRVKAQFPLAGLFVWHCHILEHEDNEMMRPYCVGNTPACVQHNTPPPPPALPVGFGGAN